MSDKFRQVMKNAYYIPLAIILFSLLKKRHLANIGKTEPRHWLYEIAVAQQNGIDLFSDYDPKDEITLAKLAEENGVKLTRRDYLNNVTRLGEKYFAQLVRKFKPIKAQIGAAPVEKVNIRNSEGEIALTVYDRNNTRRDWENAVSYVADELAVNTDSREGAEWATILAIATGTRFVWKDKANGTKGLAHHLFQGNYKDLEGERKAYFSILATEEKGGIYPERFAERLSLNENRLDAVLDMLKQFNSKSKAQYAVLQAYYDSLDEPGDDYGSYYNPDSDCPF